MATYVYGLRGKFTHETGEDGINPRCGAMLQARFLVSTQPPPDRALCPRCVPTDAALELRATQDALERKRRIEQVDAGIVFVQDTATTEKAVGRHFGWAQQTWVRNINGAMHRAGAKTRFQWGYLAGLAARDNG